MIKVEELEATIASEYSRPQLISKIIELSRNKDVEHTEKLLTPCSWRTLVLIYESLLHGPKTIVQETKEETKEETNEGI